MKQTASLVILGILRLYPDRWLACHEIVSMAREQGHYMNENAAASRLCIDLKGQAEGRTRQGARYKEWHIIPQLPSVAPDNVPL